MRAMLEEQCIGDDGACRREDAVEVVCQRSVGSCEGFAVGIVANQKLHVIVEPGWRESRAFIDSLDWRNQLEKIAEKQGNEPTED